MQDQEERCELIKVGDFYWTDFCHENKDVCSYCWTRWFHGEPCIFYKRIVVLDGFRVKIYKIRKRRLK